jgi:hypothetical protein
MNYTEMDAPERVALAHDFVNAVGDVVGVYGPEEAVDVVAFTLAYLGECYGVDETEAVMSYLAKRQAIAVALKRLGPDHTPGDVAAEILLP